MIFVNQFGKFKCASESFVVYDSPLADFQEPITGGVGKNSVIKAEFFKTIRVVPDLDILPDSPAA
ncbi:hypothetical protein AEW07_10250 [Salmonella enterica subsp. enterica serovar Derby]|nr:hypothetical protein SEED0626_07779 [Salmonella enterica subsp. enterica serovar Derby str. 626]KNN14267.1 hypothetical protein AEV09_08495 [Salmonella enterica subsp. enterica serovar Derby]KTN27055.1 hypothetical protein IN46_12280 [Salmonella enterica]OXY62955.1 hypothetical protein P730_01055 [Salmonella enterica subsp. enterica serovar Enteritidis str. SHSE004]KNP35607.1 hypothetical protein AEV69_06525 [Salmonella enterica subsp. enterica serovar Derby]